jgi:hypothetical protein
VTKPVTAENNGHSYNQLIVNLLNTPILRRMDSSDYIPSMHTPTKCHISARPYSIATQHAFRNRLNVAPLGPVPDRKPIVTWVTTFRQTRSVTRRRTGPHPNRGNLEWPARSPDLALCDLFLWGFLKSRVYVKRPRTLQDLKQTYPLLCW